MVFCVFSIVAQGQALDEMLLNCTVLIKFKPSDTTVSRGTGFLVTEMDEDDKAHLFLVTNRHLLPKQGEKKSLTIRARTRRASKAEISWIDIPIVGKDGKYLPTVAFHPGGTYDVAAVEITRQFSVYRMNSVVLTLASFATRDTLKAKSISIGAEIFIVGYPHGIYDPRNVYPLLRQGVISTVPSEEYAFNDRLRNRYNLPNQIHGFLVDANVFPGSSGSLVILKPQVIDFLPSGDVHLSLSKASPYLLGILSGSIPIEDKALGSKQRMGLGIVYSADTIKETIEQLRIRLDSGIPVKFQ